MADIMTGLGFCEDRPVAINSRNAGFLNVETSHQRGPSIAPSATYCRKVLMNRVGKQAMQQER